AEQDRELGERLASERSGILRWAVEGCTAWQRDGLGAPEDVRTATATYQADMDVLGDFLRERCRLTDGAWTATGVLFEAYQTWCHASNEKPLTSKGFAQRLKDRGIQDQRKKSGRGWLGLELLGPGEEPAESEGDALTRHHPPFSITSPAIFSR